MADHTWFLIAIAIYMAVMLFIGWSGYRKTSEYDDYVLGGRGLNPFVAALSAGASDMSGWLLMGLPGAIYLSGLNQTWIAIGLLVGAFLNWTLTAPRLRAYSRVSRNSMTVPTFFENRVRDTSKALRVTAGLVILVFFTFYVSSGMVAGGLYWESTFGGDYLTGMLIVATVTILYTLFGGFVAVSNTDAVQGVIMFIALLLVPIFALFAIKDLGQDPAVIFSWPTEHAYPGSEGQPVEGFFNMFTGIPLITIIGLAGWGLGYFGQPHIVVRFMALRKPSEAKQGRLIGTVWQLLCQIGALFVALAATVFFALSPNASISDIDSYESIFLDMTRVLFHPLVAGLILTAVLAAIMSTISSQLLVSSTALVEDLYHGIFNRHLKAKQSLLLSRLAVLAIAVFAAFLASNPNNSILDLVGFAWAGFGSAFGPVMLASLYWRRLNAPGALAGMITGTVVSFAWGSSPLTDTLYEIVPGFAAATVVMVVVSLATKKPSQEVLDEFEEAREAAKV
ncbi:sodium/proline symporter PutP [Corynebacterium sp. 335C]